MNNYNDTGRGGSLAFFVSPNEGENMTTIDITPERDEYARTLLYIFANHAPKAMGSMVADFHNLSTEQEDTLFQMWDRLEHVGAWDRMGKHAKEGLIFNVRNESEKHPKTYNYQKRA